MGRPRDCEKARFRITEQRSRQICTEKCVQKDGGASRDRTDDLIVANDALSQLSYSPFCKFSQLFRNFNSVPDVDQISEHAFSQHVYLICDTPAETNASLPSG